MKILVDADACPVKNIIINTAKKFGVDVLMVCDTSHVPAVAKYNVVTVDKGADSADIKLINLASGGDLVITQDYGVAALAVGKGAYALDNSGTEYDDSNLDRLLFERFLGKKARRAGKRTKGPAARTREDDRSFEAGIEKILKKILDSSKNMC